MRLLMEEWRKFLDEGSDERHAWNPHGSEPLSRGERRSVSSYSNMGDEVSAVVATLRAELGRQLEGDEVEALKRSGIGWSKIVAIIQGAEDKEEALRGLVEK